MMVIHVALIGNSRFPEGMTERKARAKATAEADPSLHSG
jgi:hypothetical protein